ncbi:MAG TPA: hypothetical protein VIU64_04745 [Polyangia bacterium]
MARANRAGTSRVEMLSARSVRIRIRFAIASRRRMASAGTRKSRDRKASRGNTSNRHGSREVTVADRTPPSRSAISPKSSPAPMMESNTSSPSTLATTFTRPCNTANMSPDASP